MSIAEFEAAITGEKLAELILNDQDLDKNANLQDRIRHLNMSVALSDILSCDDKYLYMRSQKFDFQGRHNDLGLHHYDLSKQGSVVIMDILAGLVIFGCA